MTADATYFQIQLGFGGTPSGGSPSWVDVTDYVRTTAGSQAVQLVTGRRSARDGITPGSLSFTLENADGRFDPLNSSGPYYGELLLGVPVRVFCRYNTVHYVQRWQGYISSPWVQDLVRYDRVVNLTAHDLIGVMGNSNQDWPTIYDSIVDQFEGGDATAHYRPGLTGWIDEVTGRRGRWVGSPDEYDSPIPGAPTSWAMQWSEDQDGNEFPPDGYGVITQPFWDGPSSSNVPDGDYVLSCAWELLEDHGSYSVFTQDTGEARDLSAWGGSDTLDTCGLAFYEDGIELVMPNADGDLGTECRTCSSSRSLGPLRDTSGVDSHACREAPPAGVLPRLHSSTGLRS